MKQQKPRLKAIIHRVEHLDLEIKQRGQKRRILRIQRYRQPIKIEDIDTTKNPEKITFLILRNDYGDRMELFAYKNNREKAFFSLNGEVIGADAIDWRHLNKALLKMGKFLGVMK